MISTFDTTIFGLTVIPIVGWFKLLPTFGGRVVTLAEKLALSEDGKLTMELERTKVTEVEGLGKIPLTADLLMDRWYRECACCCRRQRGERLTASSAVNAVWQLLPWNREKPLAEVTVVYVDDTMRIVRDMHGALFVYGETESAAAGPGRRVRRLTRPAVRPSLPLLTKGDIET